MKAEIRLTLVTLALSLTSNALIEAQDSLQTTKLTFERAWELTCQNSHVMKQVQYLQQEKDEMVKSSKGLYLPKIGITASYMIMSDDINLDLTSVRDAITPLYGALANYGNFSGVKNPDPATSAALPILPDNLSTAAVRSQLKDGLTQIQEANWDPTIQKKRFGAVAATFQLPLYVGGKIGIANRVAKIEQSEVSEVSRQRQGELLSELVERYFGLCLAKQAVLVRQDVYNGMQKHLSDAEKMQNHGLIANAEVLHAKVYNAQAERELTKSKRNVNIVNQALTNTLVIEKDTILDPVSELFYLDSIESLSYFKTTATQKNPMLSQVDSKKLLAEQKLKAERAEYMPQIALQGVYDIANKDLSSTIPDWTIGVGMNWTLFDGAARSRKVKAAAMKNSQVEEIKQKAHADIETAVDKLYNELNMYREQLTELETSKTFAEEYLRIRQKAFHEEMINATEVVDASLALASVRIERLQTMYYYDLTLARLLQYTGIPEEFPAYRMRKGVKTESYVEAVNSVQ
jgi:outer membrane protein TolC